jgi:hypothetical protein
MADFTNPKPNETNGSPALDFVVATIVFFIVIYLSASFLKWEFVDSWKAFRLIIVLSTFLGWRFSVDQHKKRNSQADAEGKQ